MREYNIFSFYLILKYIMVSFPFGCKIYNKLTSFLFQLCRFKYARNLFRVFYLIYLKKLGIED